VPGVPADVLSAIAQDLSSNRGAALVIAGDHQPAEVHALAHAINQALGAPGNTVRYIDPVEAHPGNRLSALQNLKAELDSGSVDALFIFGGNPAFDAPADLKFASSIAKAKFSVRHGLYDDETSAVCDYHVPATHFLEQWGDVRAYDGSISLIQPLTAPLHGSKSTAELIGALMGQMTDGHDQLRALYQAQGVNDDSWRKMLHDGIVPNSASKSISVKAKAPEVSSAAPGAVEVVFHPRPQHRRWTRC
jgi:anaerobic selenocysteine-containing dehydrogenase